MKAIQFRKDRNWELYDLSKDISEAHDVAADHPKLVAELKQLAADSHEEERPGTYDDPNRTVHAKDRKAKWGSRQPPPRTRKGKPGNRKAA